MAQTALEPFFTHSAYGKDRMKKGVEGAVRATYFASTH